MESIRQALVLLGIDTVRRWAALWVLAGLSAEAHPELVTMSTVRARCCELLAQTTRGPDYAAEGFLLGMCSLLDAILQRPMEVILAELPLPDEIMAALSGAENRSRHLLDCTVAYERGEFDRSLYLAGAPASTRSSCPSRIATRSGGPPTSSVGHRLALLAVQGSGFSVQFRFSVLFTVQRSVHSSWFGNAEP